MRVALKLSVTISAVFLAISLVACGGGGNGDSSSATSTPAPSNRQTAKSESGAKESAGTTAESAGEGTGEKSSEPEQKSAGSNAGKKQRGAKVPPYHGPSASAFVPKHHDDSRSGSEQFNSKSKDFTSIPDFGSEADSSEFDEVAAAFHNFMDARAEGNWAAMCGYFASNLRVSMAQFAGFRDATAADCPALIEAFGAYPPQLPLFEKEADKADVASVRIDGDRAFVIYWGTEGSIYAWPMAEEDDGWKVSGIGPEPICLQSTVTSCPRP